MVAIGQANKVIPNEYPGPFVDSAGYFHMMYHMSINGGISHRFFLLHIRLEQRNC